MKHTVAIYMVHRNGLHEPAPDLTIETREFDDETRAHDYAGVLNAITCQVLTKYRGGQKYVAIVRNGAPEPFTMETPDDGRTNEILSELEAGVRARVDEFFANEKRDDGGKGFRDRMRSLFTRGG